MKNALTLALTAITIVGIAGTASAANEKITTYRTESGTVYNTTIQNPSSENTTNRAIGKHYNSFSNDYRQPEPLASASVIDLQRTLAAEGYYKGKIDGLWGTQTTDAVRLYQESHGWPVTGRLSETDLRKMGVIHTDHSFVESTVKYNDNTGNYKRTQKLRD